MVAVTGATGGVGGRVARALAGRELPLRLVVRDASRAPELGAEIAVAEYRDGAAMRAAFAGAETVYLISGSESADRVAEHFSAVAAAVLAEPEPHDGRTYDVTGPEALSLDEAAAILSRAAGQEVVYERETLEQARDSRRPSGAPDWEIEGWVTSYAALDAGDLEPPSDTVQQILGRPPRSLADVLREHPERMAHLSR